MFKRALIVLLFIIFPKLSFGDSKIFNDRFWAVFERIPTEQSIEVILRLIPKNGWYIHSHNPGEFGMPAQIKWNTENVNIVSEQWSMGEDILYQGFRINAYINDGAYTAKLHIKSPEQKLSADVTFMSCKEECIPQKERFEFLLKDLPKAKNMPSSDILPFSHLSLNILLFAFIFFNKKRPF